MHKQQSPISVSSTVWALLVTAVVLLVAASASAQTDDAVADDSVPVSDVNQVDPAPPANIPPARMRDPATTNRVNGVAPLPSNAMREVRPANSNGTLMDALPTNASTTNRIHAWHEAVTSRKARLEEKRIALQNASTTRQARLGDAVRSNVTVGASRITTVLSNAIAKSISINERLASKAGELEARGNDMSAVNTLVSEANELLRLAMEALEGITINTEYAVTSDNPLADWEAVRQQFSEVRDLIKSAHEVMREATTIIKTNISSADDN
ncbi:hypothetical protein H6788_01295 [Candidatus Nomurabacteria bacterium]|nr:hypothetical protein [Candidatus Nomurabacteria bacterium]